MTERNTNQDYVLHSRILTAGIRRSEEAGKMPPFAEGGAPLPLSQGSHYPGPGFQRTISYRGGATITAMATFRKDLMFHYMFTEHLILNMVQNCPVFCSFPLFSTQ